MELKADIRCPNCRRTVKMAMRQMVPGTSRNCPSCAAVFKFSGDDGRKVQRAMDDLERTIKNLKF